MMANKMKGWVRFLSLFLMGASWFFRDQVAVGLEQKSKDLQTAQMQTGAQQQAETQSELQRELITKLSAIESHLSARTDEEADSRADEIQRRSPADDGTALERRADMLMRLDSQVNGSGNSNQKLAAAVNAAKEVAGHLKDQSAQPTRKLFLDWDDAEEALSKSYIDLTATAQSKCEGSQSSADMARGFAWFFTGIAGLMMGGWKVLMPGSDAEPDKAVAD